MTDDRESQLERELAELREAVVDDWLANAAHASEELIAMRQSISWRVTRGLRLVRTFQLKAREVGFANAARAAVSIVNNKVRGSR